MVCINLFFEFGYPGLTVSGSFFLSVIKLSRVRVFWSAKLVSRCALNLLSVLEWLLVVAVIYLILFMIGYSIIQHFFAFRFLISCDINGGQLRGCFAWKFKMVANDTRDTVCLVLLNLVEYDQ